MEYEETLQSIDMLGLLLSPFGFDWIADALGCAYSGYYADFTNVGIYSSGVFIPVLSAGSLKGLTKEAVQALRRGKAELVTENGEAAIRLIRDGADDVAKGSDELLDAVSQITTKTKTHILEGEVGWGYVKGEKVWTAKGVHHISAIENGFAKIDEATLVEGPNGIYKAKVFVKEGGNWIPKLTNEGYSTFFPKSWGKNKILNEISNAYKNKKLVGGNEWKGFSSNGKIEIRLYLNKEGNIISAFPKDWER